MFERNSLAVTGIAHLLKLDLNRQERINSIADNFGMCSWRPDSETVASRAFAQASNLRYGLEVSTLPSRQNFMRWRITAVFSESFVFCFSGIWPKRCTISRDRVKPGAFGSVSRSRIKAGKPCWLQQP